MQNEAENILNAIKNELASYNKIGKPRRYSENIKKMVIKLNILGVTGKEIKDHLGISLYAINRWCGGIKKSISRKQVRKNDPVMPFKKLEFQAGDKNTDQINDGLKDDWHMHSKDNSKRLMIIKHGSGFFIEVSDRAQARFFLEAIASL